MSHAGGYPFTPTKAPAARQFFPARRHGIGERDAGYGAARPPVSDVCLGWAWGVCLLVLIVAWLVLTIIYIVKVASHQSQAKLVASLAIPATANLVQTSVPVQIYVRQPASAGTAQRAFVASNGMGKIAASSRVSDYAAAVRLVPSRQKVEGLLSDGDEAKLLFIRDGVWLTATGDLSPDAAQAASVAVKGAGQGELIRASMTVQLGTPGATTGGADPIAAALQPQRAGSSILPFLNGSGC